VIQNRIVSKVLLGAALFITSMGSTACATGSQATPNTFDAVLLNMQDGPTREAIRVFVRQQSGPAVIVLPDSLAKSPVLAYQQRQNRGSSVSRQDFKPIGEYRLVMDSEGHCWLNHISPDGVTQIALPPSASCAAYQAS